MGEHGLVFRLASDPSRLDEDMQSLARLHAARWGEEGSGALRPEAAAFHREFAALALERGWLRLWLAEVDDWPIAAWYGFRFGGAESYYQSGRDPAWDRESVGLVLLAHTIREAMNDSIGEYEAAAGRGGLQGPVRHGRRRAGDGRLGRGSFRRGGGGGRPACHPGKRALRRLLPRRDS
jgi:hypothetical protein